MLTSLIFKDKSCSPCLARSENEFSNLRLSNDAEFCAF